MQPLNENSEKALSVSEYIEYLNDIFEQHELRIKGEISELNIWSSGHVYFTIKDKDEEAVLNCIMWKGNYQICDIDLEVGMEVIVTGHANIYAKNGKFSFIADTVELVGEGALKKAYDALKKKLEEEGLFAVERKRKLPDLVQRIGLITSKEGAVIHDFQSNLNKYGFKIIFINSKVEGQTALKDLLAAIQAMEKQDVEVLVIIRGGGSLESLQAFNNENLVRAIADFPVPVIAGIGHDKDVPLVALVADYTASTPTAAALIVGRSWDEALERMRAFTNIIKSLEVHIQQVGEEIADRWGNVVDLFSNVLKDTYQKFEMAQKIVLLNDPKVQLRLGYSITRRNGDIIKQAEELRVGDVIETQLEEGEINSKVQ